MILMLVLLIAPESPLDGIDKLGYAERYERWRQLSRLTQSDPTVMIRLRTIAERGKGYQRFVAAANVAGFGTPTYCGPIATKDMPLYQYIGLFQGTYKTTKSKITCDPTIRQLRVSIESVPERQRFLQETLWEILQNHLLDFRVEPDGTFHIIRLPI